MPTDPTDKLGEDLKKAQENDYTEISNLEEINNTDGARARIAEEQGEPVPAPVVNDFSDKQVEQKVEEEVEAANPEDDKEENHQKGVNMNAKFDPIQAESYRAALNLLDDGILPVMEKDHIKVHSRRKGADAGRQFVKVGEKQFYDKMLFPLIEEYYFELLKADPHHFDPKAEEEGEPTPKKSKKDEDSKIPALAKASPVTFSPKQIQQTDTWTMLPMNDGTPFLKALQISLVDQQWVDYNVGIACRKLLSSFAKVDPTNAAELMSKLTVKEYYLSWLMSYMQELMSAAKNVDQISTMDKKLKSMETALEVSNYENERFMKERDENFQQLQICIASMDQQSLAKFAQARIMTDMYTKVGPMPEVNTAFGSMGMGMGRPQEGNGYAKPQEQRPQTMFPEVKMSDGGPVPLWTIDVKTGNFVKVQ